MSFQPHFGIVAFEINDPLQSMRLHPIDSSGLEDYLIQYYYNFEKKGDQFFLRVRPDSIASQSHYLAKYTLESDGVIRYSNLLEAYLYPERLRKAEFNYELSGAYVVATDNNLFALFRNDGTVFSHQNKYPVNLKEQYFSGTLDDLTIHMANDDLSTNSEGGVVIMRANYLADRMEIYNMTVSGEIIKIAEFPSSKYVYGKVCPSFAILSKVNKPKMKRTIFYWK